MNVDKRSKVMLNISLSLSMIYFVLFLVGYFLQRHTLWKILSGEYAVQNDVSVPFSFVIIAESILIAMCTIVLNLLLKRKRSRKLTIGAEIFSFAAFTVNCLVKGIVPRVQTILLEKSKGDDGVFAGIMHFESVRLLETALCAFFTVSLTLMVCVCHNMRCKRNIAVI